VIILECKTGWEGDKEKGPYDAIHVGAAAASVPRSLVEQLKVSSVLPSLSHLHLIRKQC